MRRVARYCAVAVPLAAVWLGAVLAHLTRLELRELPHDELERLIRTLEEEMHTAATDLRFEYAARLRDEINDLKRELRDVRTA